MAVGESLRTTPERGLSIESYSQNGVCTTATRTGTLRPAACIWASLQEEAVGCTGQRPVSLAGVGS